MKWFTKKLDPKQVKILKAAAFILVAVLSVTVVGGWASDAEHQAHIISKLDDKKETVLELAAAATATSIAITLLPGDTATPVADQLAELTGYFLLILCAIYLEKYLVTVIGFATFRILIPLAMVLFLINCFKHNATLKRAAMKLTVFAVALYLVIPGSVYITSMIDRTYETSIQSTLDAAKKAGDEIVDMQEEETDEEEAPEEEGGFLQGIMDLPESIREKAGDLVSTVTGVTAGMLEGLKNVLHRFIEAIAVMIITSCVIPLLVLAAFILLARAVLNGMGVQRNGK